MTLPRAILTVLATVGGAVTGYAVVEHVTPSEEPVVVQALAVTPLPAPIATPPEPSLLKATVERILETPQPKFCGPCGMG